MAEFAVEGELISISVRDADRVVERLQALAGDCTAAADKIKRATQGGQSATVRLAIGEDDCVLEALAELRASGDFVKPLERLDHAIRAKIDRER